MEPFNRWTVFILSMLSNISIELSLDKPPLLDIQLDELATSLRSMDFEKIGSDLNKETIDSITCNLETDNEDVNMSGFELITKYGYVFEEHWVQTEDGYVLELVRLPGKGPVVLVAHGLLSSFVDFISPGPDSGLPFLLADAGYDVWLINFRGNTYSRNHTTLSPNDKEFWNFTWHEMGILDLPATIDYILCETGQAQLIYIGHSQGTTSVLVLMAEVPKYNPKLKLVILLSPVAFMSKVKSPLVRVLVPLQDVEYFILKALGLYEFLPDDKFTKTVQHLLCPTNTVTNYVCSNIIFLLCGYDFAQINETYFPSEFFHTPSGAATKQIIHYLQEVKSHRFGQFDYGETGNLEKYNSILPPQYDLSKITAPVALYHASNDWLSDVDNVQTLAKNLSNIAEQYLVPFKKFNHLDFLWAKDVVVLLYSRVLELMEKYN